jgi:hypothetical protein
MGADKILPQGRTRHMPQIHNLGFPHEFAKVSSHNGPTNTRNKRQTIPVGRSTKPLLAKNSWPNESKRKRSGTCDEHKEHLAESYLADSPHVVLGQSAKHADKKQSSTS